MAKATCSIEDCEKTVQARGMCPTHYARWRKTENPRRCTVPKCDRAHYAHGLCELHYDRWRRSGDPECVSVIRGDDLRRFWSYVTRRTCDECWPWTGTITKEGYGVFSLSGRQIAAHRHAYQLLVGPIPKGLTLDHICHTDHPHCNYTDTCQHRRCVNPAHLEPVTANENTRRALQRRAALAYGRLIPATSRP